MIETNEKTGSNNNVIREFRLTTLALRNKSTVFLMAILLAVFGLVAYNTMPMELFPEVNLSKVIVTTIYPGNPPIDMENLITRPLEKEIHTVNGIKEMRSVSNQDESSIIVDFNTGVDINDALRDVKDAVDKAKSELPNDLDMDPIVMDIDVNEFPILFINLYGDYSLNELEDYAEFLEDEIEAIPEISKVEIKGLDNREIQINVDPLKLVALRLGFGDIEDAVGLENVSMSGGDLVVDKNTRTIRTVAEFTDVKQLENIIIKREDAKDIVYLRDVATVVDGFEDPLTYARLDRKPVVSLQVVKKAGENLLNATDKIMAILDSAKKSGAVPELLNISISNDQSKHVRNMVDNLENSIIMGVIFVVLVLFFFLGLRNALFVGMAIPMSMFISFVVLSLMGDTLNMMVLFGLVLALGMLVDNAIVVVENIYRFIHQGYSLFDAAKTAVGEIAMPIIASTATTLAAFFPLVFWPGMVGEFMKRLPVTLIIVLTSSLFVALVIIPVLAARFIKKEEEIKAPSKKKSLTITGILAAMGVFFYVTGFHSLGTFLVFIALLVILNLIALHNAAEWFQRVFLAKLEIFYLKTLKASLRGKRPVLIVSGTFVLMILVMMFFNLRKPDVVFFPINEPSFVNVTAELPISADIRSTDTFMHKLENKIFEVIQPYEAVVESVQTTVGKGVVSQNEIPIGKGNSPHKGMVTISFVDYEDRGGINTREIMMKISSALLGKYPGVTISIEKDNMGPPTGKPINLEISGPDFERLIHLTQDIRKHLETSNVPGVEGLKMDLDLGRAEVLVEIDRDKVRRFGLSTMQVAGTIRTSIFGKEVSDFKEGEDEYPIMLRLDKKYRHDISALMNQKITFRSQTNGKYMHVPISSVANFKYGTTYGSVNRLDMDRVITLWSNVIEGYNAQKINERLAEVMKDYKMPDGYIYSFTGEQEEQKENADFLARTMMIAIASIMLILVTQFNSFVKPLIILASIVFSTIGVFGGLATFRMDFVIIMTGIGIISLAGIVVNNAIVLIDYIDYLKANAKRKLGLDQGDNLPLETSIECVIQGGRTRLRPVLLTAITTILGLTPMAIGLNINFETLMSRFDPQIYFGGDNALFWGPMAVTVIFGLTFATILTLVVVPAMYVIGNEAKLAFIEKGFAALLPSFLMKKKAS